MMVLHTHLLLPTYQFITHTLRYSTWYNLRSWESAWNNLTFE